MPSSARRLRCAVTLAGLLFAVPAPRSALGQDSLPTDSEPPAPFPIRRPVPRQPTLRETVFFHPPVSKAVRGKPVEIMAEVPPGLDASTVLIAYRARESDPFLVREMAPMQNAPGWFLGTIPASATQKTHVAYYLETRNLDGDPLGRHGSPEHPHRIVLIPEFPASEVVPREGTTPGKAVEQDESFLEPDLWFVLALGSGGGYHAGRAEFYPDASGFAPGTGKSDGFGFARLLHAAPEVGFFLRKNLILSAQGRFQYGSGPEEIDNGSQTYRLPQWSLAGLIKLSWLPCKPRHHFQPFLSLELGAGQIRHSITTPGDIAPSVCGASATCKNTIVGGVGWAGVGAGVIFMTNQSTGLYAAFNLLSGWPDFLVNGDLNLGLVLLR